MTAREMKSKVMTLGNRLAAGGNDRSAAFVRAWVIVKQGSLELAVKGTSFGTRQEALRRLATYDPAQVRAFIVPQQNNPADPSAVAVMVGVQNGRGLYCLGYLPKEQAAVAAVFKAASLRILDGNIRGAKIALSA